MFYAEPDNTQLASPSHANPRIELSSKWHPWYRHRWNRARWAGGILASVQEATCVALGLNLAPGYNIHRLILGARLGDISPCTSWPSDDRPSLLVFQEAERRAIHALR